MSAAYAPPVQRPPFHTHPWIVQVKPTPWTAWMTVSYERSLTHAIDLAATHKSQHNYWSRVRPA